MINSIKKILTKTIRSMLFMCTGVLAYRASTCVFSHLFKQSNIWLGVIQCYLCSLGSLWEDGKRSLTLALFMYPKGLEGMFDMCVKRGWLCEIPLSLSLLFALSMTVSKYMQEKGTLSNSYSSLLDKLID